MISKSISQYFYDLYTIYEIWMHTPYIYLYVYLYKHVLHWCWILEVEGKMQLKEHLTDGRDYKLLPEDGWEFLVQIYGTLDSLKVSLQ